MQLQLFLHFVLLYVFLFLAHVGHLFTILSTLYLISTTRGPFIT